MIQLSQVRQYLTPGKRVIKDTGWQTGDLPPRFSVHATTRPAAKRWEWRCLVLESTDGRAFRLLIEAAPQLSKWKAMLILVPPDGPPRAVLRFEDQRGSQGGLHVHAHCDTNRDLTGSSTVNMTYTLPDHGQRRRRHNAWTKALFCMTAGTFFGVSVFEAQEELGL